MKILNDSSIIDCTPLVIYDGCQPTRWVLRYIPESYQPYVIHQQNMKLASDGHTWEHKDYHNGKYFTNLVAATQEFKKKSNY